MLMSEIDGKRSDGVDFLEAIRRRGSPLISPVWRGQR